MAKGPEPRSALSAASISVRGALLAFMPAHRLRRPRPRYELGGRPGRNRMMWRGPAVLVPAQRRSYSVRRSEWTTPLLSVEEGQRALGGIFEIVAADKAGVVG